MRRLGSCRKGSVKPHRGETPMSRIWASSVPAFTLRRALVAASGTLALLIGLILAPLTRAADDLPAVPATHQGIREFREQVRLGNAQVVLVGVRQCADNQSQIRKHAED